MEEKKAKVLFGLSLMSLYFLFYSKDTAVVNNLLRKTSGALKPTMNLNKFSVLNLTCPSATRIAFVKTHKTASSSVQNILLRYGYHANLSLVLGSYVHCNPGQVKQMPWHPAVMRKDGYDIFACHFDWNLSYIRSLVGANTTMVTIVREPSTIFESGYSYFDVENKTGIDIHQFISRIGEGKISPAANYDPFSINYLMFDFGLYKESELTNLTVVRSKIEELDSIFDLVMVANADLMDQSLVLLADLLCLPLSAVVAVRVNARKPGEKNDLTSSEREILKSIQYPDQALYHHFRRKLQRAIMNFGVERMKARVAELKRLREATAKNCSAPVKAVKAANGTLKTGNRTTKSPFSPWSKKILVTKTREDIEECALIGYSEVGLLRFLRKYMSEKYSGNQSRTTPPSELRHQREEELANLTEQRIKKHQNKTIANKKTARRTFKEGQQAVLGNQTLKSLNKSGRT